MKTVDQHQPTAAADLGDAELIARFRKAHFGIGYNAGKHHDPQLTDDGTHHAAALEMELLHRLARSAQPNPADLGDAMDALTDALDIAFEDYCDDIEDIARERAIAVGNLLFAYGFEVRRLALADAGGLT